MTPETGIYFRVIHVPRTTPLIIGKRVRSRSNGGYYVYVGSAMGPGGLKARVERHLSDEKKVHWHIDHLLMARNEKG